MALAQATVPAKNVSTAIGADGARAAYGIDGSGLRIGILSSSFDTLGGMAADEADGWLPPADQVNVVRDNPSGTTDEGRAMAEMVHAIAPGASIDFYSPSGQENGIAQGIQAMQADGCSVICDDITRADEPFWQLGALDEQAIRSFTRAGGVYFTDASNAGTSSARQDTVSTMDADLPGIGAVQAVDLGTGGGGVPSPFASFTVGNTRPVSIDMQWSQPWQSLDGQGAGYSLGIAIFDADGNLVQKMASDQTGDDPIQVLTFKPPSAGTYSYALYVNGGDKADGDLVKVVMNADGTPPLTIDGANSGSCFGHNADPDAITVGAVKLTHTDPYGGSLSGETFSSGGPSTYVYDAAGHRMSHRSRSSSVDVSAPDAQATSLPAGEMNPYYGTSAATPVAAATALLMKAANGALDAQETKALLQGTAEAFGDPVYSGAGLVQARGALAMAEESNTLLRNDLYGDGRSALVFQDGSDTAQVWAMRNDKVADAEDIASPGAGWKYVASGDFGQDKSPALAWQDAAGDLAFSTFSGGVAADPVTVAGPGRGWTCVGSGDFDGDGNSDLVFQNSARQVVVDLLQGDQVTSTEKFTVRANNGNKVVGVGDFNMDGTTDLLMEARDGTLTVLDMAGGKVAGKQAMGFKLDSNQVVAGIGDLGGKGASDILVQDKGSGELTRVTTTDGGASFASADIGVVAPSLKVQGIGHFDGNAQSGILLQDKGSGAVEALALSGDSVYSTTTLGNAGQGWAASVR